MSYRPFSRMTETARRTELWRLVLGIVMVVIVGLERMRAARSADDTSSPG